MSRYIDADKVTEAFVKAAKQVGNIGDQIAFRMMINEIPAADVVEVVRCKDCKHWQDGGFSSYCICDGFTHSDDYCSYGERKDEGL